MSAPSTPSIPLDPKADETRRRILVRLAYNLDEAGDTTRALGILDALTAESAETPAAILATKAAILARSGKLDEAMSFIDRAIEALREEASEDLATVLLNRGFLFMQLGKLPEAQLDTEEAERLAVAEDSAVVVFMARYNLGYIKFLAGDLPGSLAAMSAAEELAPEAALGVPALDRARVLLAAGLVGEAGDYASGAIATFTENRAVAYLADALMVRADIAVMAGDPETARLLARQSARISRRRGNRPAALLAQLAEQRAQASLRRDATTRPVRPGVDRRRSMADARSASALSEDLAAAGLAQDAVAASLLAADAHLDAQEVSTAAAFYADADSRGASLGVRLQARLVGARIDMARGRRPQALILLRRGLDELAAFQALFGSQDLQAAAAVWGRELSREGLRAAVATGAPGAILQWLERSRATTTRLPHVRPPADPGLAADLGALRVAQDAARAAVLSGRPDPEREREVGEIRRRIRARSWALGGTGSALRPPTLSSVRRVLAAPSGRPEASNAGVVLAYFYGAGAVHLLRITPTTASYHRLADFDEFEALNRRAAADLELLSSDRIPEAIRQVARRSLAATLRQLSQSLVEPILDRRLRSVIDLRYRAAGRRSLGDAAGAHRTCGGGDALGDGEPGWARASAGQVRRACSPSPGRS